MRRVALPAGAVIQVNSREYTVLELIGDGATCMVYSAYYTDTAGFRHRVNLKECYPYHADIIREQHNLLWQSCDEKTQCISSFVQAYEKLMTWQNNSTVKVFDLCEANDTLYIVMDSDNGQPFDQDRGSSLHELLRTTLALTKTVQQYHQNGYLHLDIKPSNFLTIPETRELVILFDLDSIATMEDIRSGKVRCVSYSDGWAAPEQKQGQLARLSPATDIFAIGAILFEKIMGRQVAPEDMSIFADWDFSSALFDEANPKIKRIMRTIFRKTLAANIKRRYQGTAELSLILEQACQVTAAGVPYLVSDCPALSTQFFGREREMVAIRQAFKEKARAIFLHGEGGIGKSTLAIAYASNHMNDYDAILFCRYKTSLEDLLVDLADGIQNCDGNTTEKLRLLKRLLDQNILLIVDNFDVEIDQDDGLDEFLHYKAHILFTTRTNFSSVYAGEVPQIEVSSLPHSKLVQVFAHASNLDISSVHEDQLNTLLRFVDNNTYGTELLGLQITSSGCSLNELIAKLSRGLEGLAQAEKVRTKKDGKPVKKRLPDVIRTLFQIADLNEDRKRTLRNLYLLRFLNIDHETYRWYSYEFNQGIDILNDLVETGWVRYDTNRRFFSLHPLVEELVKTDLTPNEGNCTGVYHVINQLIKDTVDYDGYDDADEYEFEHNCHFLCSFFASLDFSVSEHRQKVINWFIGLIEHEHYIGSPHDYYFKKLHQKLLAEAECRHTTPQETFDIRYILVNVWCYEFSYFRAGETPEERKKREEIRLLEFRSAFDHAKEAANALPAPQREDALNLLYTAIPWGRTAIDSDIPKDYLLQLYLERPSAFVFAIDDKDWLGIPVSDEERKNAELGRERAILPTNFSVESSGNNTWTAHINAVKDALISAESPLDAAKALLKADKTPIYEAVALLIGYCDEVIHQIIISDLPDDTEKYLESINWDDFQRIVDLVDSVRKSTGWLEKYDGYDLDENDFFTHTGDSEPYVSSIHSLQKHRVITAAIKADFPRFCELMETDPGPEDNRQNPQYVRFSFFLDDIAMACNSIGRNSYIVPYLIKHMEDLGIDPENYLSGRDYVKNYVMIREMAKLACCEVSQDDNRYMHFEDIVEQMTAIINRITGKRYSFKEEIESLGGRLEDDATNSDIDSSLERLYKQRFSESQDKVAFVQTILANPSLTGFEKASRIANCIDGIFMTFHFGIRHPNRCYDLDWVQLEEVLDLEEEHLVSDDWHPKDRYESDEWNGFVSFNYVNLAIVYAATNNTEMFEQYVDLILDDIKRSVTWCIEHDMHWTRFLSLKSYDNLHLLSLVNGLSFIKKQGWIVHYLIRIEQGWKDYAERKGFKDEDAFFPLYKSISECAEQAWLEDDVPPQYQEDFFEIYMSYQDKMNEIAGANYTLRLDDE